MPTRPLSRRRSAQSNTRLSAHQVLLAAVELLDGPHDGVTLGRVNGRADRHLERGRARVGRHRNGNLYIVGRRALLELRLDLDEIFDARAVVGLAGDASDSNDKGLNTA